MIATFHPRWRESTFPRLFELMLAQSQHSQIGCMKILTAQQMREIDRLTVERAGILYATLMETAGARVVEAIIERYGSVEGKCCTVYCGKGNNGGDGAVIARLLWMQGASKINVYLLGHMDGIKGEARTNLDIIRHLAKEEKTKSFERARIDFVQVATEAGAEFLDDSPEFADLIIDALLGTGLTRPAEGLYAKAIERLNYTRQYFSASARIISVDIPSGLSSDGAHPIGPHEGISD